MGGEVGLRSGEEPGAGGALLVGQDLGVGELGMVIDQGADVVEPDLGAAVAGDAGGSSAVRAPPPPSGMRPISLRAHGCHEIAGWRGLRGPGR
jgi:hypothetical protein